MTRHLILVLGDQLGWDNPALADFDPAQDRLLMIEADSEAGDVWNHQARIAIFLSGMRHFANVAHCRRWPCTYMKVDDSELPPDFAGRLAQALATQTRDPELQTRFAPIAAQLTAAENHIVAEMIAVQGKPADIGGYYQPDDAKASAALRPSKTLNDILATV